MIVVYDELEAREPVAWTWLLHSHNRMAQAGENAVAASNGAAEGRMELFTSGELTLNLTDRLLPGDQLEEGARDPTAGCRSM